ncbi:MAG: serine/threonine protein kinase [Deltaproteobacteria bacterium]|nr:MAG: serine/threonine protein kinase [Deltaproteobacteria bacterium]
MLDRPAAVKVLHAALAASPGMVDRFVREAQAVNRIRHPNIIDIFDFGALADGRPFFVMELLAPDDLERRVAASGRLVVAEVLAILAPICRALDAAHRAGYIHRDLKARNIGFAVGRDGAEVPKLLDFGIAKLLEDGHGATGTIRVGTPHCMSPEQIRGERIDARTDIYALGVLLHHLLTGRYPFEADDPAEIERLHLEAPPPAPSRLAPVPPALDALVTRALAKTPAARPASVRELLELLAAAAPAAPVRRDAVAIRVVLDVPDPPADDDLDDAAASTDRAVALLDGGGFTPVLVTQTSALAARVVAAPADRDRARAVAAAVERALASRPRARPDVVARVVVHSGPVELAEDTGAFVGGPLLEVHTWPRR